MSINGLTALTARLNQLARDVPGEVGRALYQEALVEEKESRRRTPVLTGALRASHETDQPLFSGRDISVTIRVGGPAAPYAVVVHEDMEAEHKNGRAKFLESTILESRPYLAARVARRIDLNEMAG